LNTIARSLRIGDGGYHRKKDADRISYEWDRLIDRFLEHGDPAQHERYSNQSPAETEQGLRLMAAETRFRRRQLADLFVLMRETWTPEDLAELQQRCKELGLWVEDRVEHWFYRQDEFPMPFPI